MSAIDLIFIFGAKYLYVVIVALAGVSFLMLPRNVQKRMIFLACIALPLAYLIAVAAGHLYYDPRPFVVGHFVPLVPHDPDNGFPSDHALLASSVAALFYPFRRKLSIGFFALAILVAISRVYVGVHHAVDVIGSFAIVFIATGAAWFVLKRYGTMGSSAKDSA